MPTIYDPFKLSISTPLPEGRRLAWIDLNTGITATEWTTGIGGYGVLNVGYRRRGMPPIAGDLHSQIEIPPLATVGLYIPSDTGFCAYHGRVQKVNYRAGLEAVKFSASGFGTAQGALGDDWFYVPASPKGTKTIDDVGRSAVNLLYRMVHAVTDILRVGDREQVVDPGGDYTPRQQAGRYLGQAVDQIVKAGAGGGQDVMFAVYADRRIQLHIVEPPVDDDNHFMPHYRMALDQRIDWEIDGSRLIGECAVEYTLPGAAKQTTPVASIPGWSDNYGGLTRSMLVPTSNMSLAQAIQVRDRYLRRYSVPIQTGTITLAADDPCIEGRYGQPVPYWMYQYGQWIGIGDSAFYIKETHTNATNRQTEVTFTNVPLSTAEVG